MKRFALIATCVGLLTMIGSANVTANDGFGHGHRIAHHNNHHVGHGFYQGNSFGHGYVLPHQSHGYRTHVYPGAYSHGFSHGYAPGIVRGHGYIPHGYSHYRHGGIRLSTPHFGLRIGH